jgi:hypothetical protein
VNASVYDIDLFDNGAPVVASLHARGRRVVCYLDVGTWEPFRPDAGSFPASLRGNAVEGFPEERWLDIRQLGTLLPIMAARFDACKAKGFDGVEPDNVDGYANPSGFPLTGADQLAYNRAIAGLAHARGLSVALKNDVGQVSDLVGVFDFSVDEQCAEFQECNALRPFIQAGKAVFHVEYNLAPGEFCSVTTPLRFSSMLKHEDLDAYRVTC